MEERPPRSPGKKIRLALSRVIGSGREAELDEFEPFEYAPWGRRIAAFVLDAVIAVPLTVLAYGLWVDGLGMTGRAPGEMQAFDPEHRSLIAIIFIGPGLLDLVYTMVSRVAMTPGMHVARLGIVDTEELGTHPTRVQLLVRWLVKWVGILALPPVSWAVMFIWALFVPTRRGLHEMASHTITYRRPIWNEGPE